MTKRHKTVATHGLAWTVYFLYLWLANASIVRESCAGVVADPYRSEFVWTAINAVVTAGAGYFTLYVLIERLYLRRRYRLFYVGLAISVVGFTLLYRTLTYMLLYPTYYTYVLRQFPLLYLPKLLLNVVEIYTVVGVAVMLYFINQWNQQRQENQQLQLDKREAELELLKSQVQPHFMFNTLNNIYALSLKGSPQTPEMIFRLSSLLDYMLYDSRAGQIPLQHELDYISNYLNLQRIRYGASLDVAMHVAPLPDRVVIAPLLLLPFVENCFKHGVSQQVGRAWIRIEIEPVGDFLQILIQNSKAADDSAAPGSDRSGIGLANVRRRLAILYNDQHTLTIQNAPDQFRVCLTFRLSALLREDDSERIETGVDAAV